MKRRYEKGKAHTVNGGEPKNDSMQCFCGERAYDTENAQHGNR